MQFYPGGSYENHPVQDFTCCMYLYCHVYAVKPPILDTLLRTPLRINSFLLRTLPITNTFYYRHLSDRGASLLRTPLLFGHLFITDTSLLQRFFITDIPLVWTSLYGHLCYVKTSLLRTLLWKALYHGHLSVSTANTH